MTLDDLLERCLRLRQRLPAGQARALHGPLAVGLDVSADRSADEGFGDTLPGVFGDLLAETVAFEPVASRPSS